jgi:hypothetical protein
MTTIATFETQSEVWALAAHCLLWRPKKHQSTVRPAIVPLSSIAECQGLYPYSGVRWVLLLSSIGLVFRVVWYIWSQPTGFSFWSERNRTVVELATVVLLALCISAARAKYVVRFSGDIQLHISTPLWRRRQLIAFAATVMHQTRKVRQQMGIGQCDGGVVEQGS